MMNLFEMLQAIFGKNIMSKTIGTRTNVIKFPSNKNNPLTTSFDVARASDNPALIEKLKKIIEDEAPYIAKMNDSERSIYEGNVRRLHDHLVSTGEVKPAVSAEVIGLGDKQPVTGKGLESLTEQAGQLNPPGTAVGNIESRINKLKQLSQEMEKATGEKVGVGDILKQFGIAQGSMSRMHEEGLVRATARQILINDIKAGKIKNMNASEVLNMKEPLDPFRQIYGEGALEQLDSLVPEFKGLKTEAEAEKLARSKFKFEPDETRLPGSVSIEEGKKAEQEFGINSPKGLDYLTGGEPQTKIIPLNDPSKPYKPFGSDFTRQEKVDWLIKNVDQEAKVTIPSPEFLQNMLDNGRGDLIDHFWEIHTKNIGRKPEINLDTSNLKNPGLVKAMMEERASKPKLVYSKEKTVKDSVDDAGKVNKDDPEKFATGGRVGYQTGGPTNKILKYMIDTLVKEKDFNRQLLERSKPELVEGLFKQTYKKSPEEIANAVNEQLKGKSSMEVMNPKTGEITSPTEPVKTAEEPRTLGGLPIDERSANIGDRLEEFSSTPITTLERRKQYLELRSEFIDSLDPRRKNKALDFQRKSIDTENKLILKAEEKGLDFDTFEELRKRLYDTRKQKTLDFMRTGKVDLEPMKPATTFEEVQDRHKTAAKAADEIFPDYNDPKIAASELANVMAEQKHGKTFDSLTGDKQSDLYSEAYNYITSVNRLPKVSPANVPTEVLQHKMNEVLNSYDKSMFIKDKQGMVDVSHPENVAKMEELLRRDHPELHSQLKKLADDVGQKETLLDFDVTGRQPNAEGGIIRKKYGHEGAANPKRAQITAIYGEGTLPKDYSKGLDYLTGK